MTNHSSIYSQIYNIIKKKLTYHDLVWGMDGDEEFFKNYNNNNYQIVRNIGSPLNSMNIHDVSMLVTNNKKIKIFNRIYRRHYLTKKYLEINFLDDSLSFKLIDGSKTLRYVYNYKDGVLINYEDSEGNWYDSNLFDEFVFDCEIDTFNKIFDEFNQSTTSIEKTWKTITDPHLIEYISCLAVVDEGAFRLLEIMNEKKGK